MIVQRYVTHSHLYHKYTSQSKSDHLFFILDETPAPTGPHDILLFCIHKSQATVPNTDTGYRTGQKEKPVDCVPFQTSDTGHQLVGSFQ
jgi:hypothetical protein